jgi:hypothetical protein
MINVATITRRGDGRPGPPQPVPRDISTDPPRADAATAARGTAIAASRVAPSELP